jgi:hypothetical protein
MFHDSAIRSRKNEEILIVLSNIYIRLDAIRE